MAKKRIESRKTRPLADGFLERIAVIVYSSGSIRLKGNLCDNPSAAAKTITNRPTNGWTFWRVRQGGKSVFIRELRGAS